jgi:hypothetical protein
MAIPAVGRLYAMGKSSWLSQRVDWSIYNQQSASEVIYIAIAFLVALRISLMTKARPLSPIALESFWHYLFVEVWVA